MSKKRKKQSPKTNEASMRTREDPALVKASATSEPGTAPSSSGRFMRTRRDRNICIALAIITFAVYARSLTCDFITFDDRAYIHENEMVKNGLSAEGVKWAFTSVERSNYWHPVTWLSHMLDVDLYGLKAGGHHFTNVVLHILNACLLFLLIQRLTGATWRSAFVAALFALHPLHVESVAWIAQRKDLLSTLFWFLTMWAYAGYARERCSVISDQSSGRGPSLITDHRSLMTLRSYGLALLFFVLGLMSKPMLVTLPFALLLLDVWPLGRLATAGGRKAEGGSQGTKVRRGWWPLVIEKIPFFAIAALAAVAAYITQEAGGALADMKGIPFEHRIPNAILSYATYIVNMCWPSKLAIYYPHAEGALPLGLATVAAVVLSCISMAAFWSWKRLPYVFTGWFWYLGTLVPVIGLIQIGSFARADRYTYISLIGIFVIIAWGLPDVIRAYRERGGKGKKREPASLPPGGFHRTWAVSATLVLVACAALTWKQLGYWKDSGTLFGHARKVTRDNYMAYFALGDHAAVSRAYVQAIQYYKEALRLRRNSWRAWYNLGFAQATLGQASEATQSFLNALKINPAVPKAHFNIGAFLAERGQMEEAIRHYEAELRINPKSAMALNNLGTAALSVGDLDRAARYLTEALAINPTLAEAHQNMGAVLDRQNRPQEALAHFSEAVRIDPQSPRAQTSLGNALLSQGRYQEAAVHISEALRIDPSSVSANFGRGRLLAAQGKITEAITVLNQAAQWDPKDVLIQHLLGRLHFMQGNTAKAVEHYRRVIEIDPGWLEVLNNLAWILATNPDDALRNGKEAVELAGRACEVAMWNHPVPLDTLGMAHAEAGDFDKAVELAEKALELLKDSDQQEMEGQIRERIALYQEEKPYRSEAVKRAEDETSAADGDADKAAENQGDSSE